MDACIRSIMNGSLLHPQRMLMGAFLRSFIRIYAN